MAPRPARAVDGETLALVAEMLGRQALALRELADGLLAGVTLLQRQLGIATGDAVDDPASRSPDAVGTTTDDEGFLTGVKGAPTAPAFPTFGSAPAPVPPPAPRSSDDQET